MGFLNKEKTSKSFVYFISEIAIVTCGIFIAIQLNNLNQDRKDKVEERKALKRILSDLKTEKLVLGSTLKQIKKSENYLKKVVYQSKGDNLDSLYFNMGNLFIHYPVNSEYINLKYSGKLGLISNDTIRYNLVNYYEVYYTLYNEISLDHKNFMNSKVQDYFDKEFTSDTTFLINPIDVESKLKSDELKKLITNQIGFYNNITNNVKTNPIDSLVKRLNTELKK
jgi:Family of unknown function (DUF6090)